mmetsp:Transcript_2363/g.8434  ORF Transcript_2363/g.8434 Transcript_2363/m.8434 type:complete len:289 (+) Transcript_2363:1056-1922(+)
MMHWLRVHDGLISPGRYGRRGAAVIARIAAALVEDPVAHEQVVRHVCLHLGAARLLARTRGAALLLEHAGCSHLQVSLVQPEEVHPARLEGVLGHDCLTANSRPCLLLIASALLNSLANGSAGTGVGSHGGLQPLAEHGIAAGLAQALQGGRLLLRRVYGLHPLQHDLEHFGARLADDAPHELLLLGEAEVGHKHRPELPLLTLDVLLQANLQHLALVADGAAQLASPSHVRRDRLASGGELAQSVERLGYLLEQLFLLLVVQHVGVRHVVRHLLGLQCGKHDVVLRV